MKRLDFYKSVTGSSPIEDFLDKLSDNQAKKILWVMKLVRELDPVPSQYFTKLVNTDEIWEVRVQSGGNIFRLLGFIEGDRLVILTNGFQKKTQKTPRREIELAESRKREYQSREALQNGRS